MKNENDLWKKKTMIVLRVAFGGVFVYASISKILNPGSFAEVVFNYSILPPFLINFVAVVLPWIECLAGLAVIFNKGAKGGIFILNTLQQNWICGLMFLGMLSCLSSEYFYGKSFWWNLRLRKNILISTVNMARMVNF